MFNPLQPFDYRYLPLFINKGVRFFVKQSYERGNGFLIIHFETAARAKEYYDAIADDPAREFYDLNDILHYKQLYVLLKKSPEQNYYTTFKLKDAEKTAKMKLDRNIKSYIRKLNWYPASGEKVYFLLDLVWGEFFVKLKYRDHEKHIKLTELENQ